MNQFLRDRGVQLEDIAEPEVSSFRMCWSTEVKTTSFLQSSLLSHELACRFDAFSCKILVVRDATQLTKFGVP